MAEEKLVVYEHNGNYYIGWYLPDEEDIGATLGEDLTTINKATTEEGVDDHVIATKYLMSLDCDHDTFGYYWESKTKAQKILREINAQIKMKLGNPGISEMPDWAQKALAEGWTPPKDWKLKK